MMDKKKIREHQNFEFNKKEIATGIDVHQDFTNKKHIGVLGEEFEIGEGIFNLTQEEYKNYNFSTSEKASPRRPAPFILFIFINNSFLACFSWF